MLNFNYDECEHPNEVEEIRFLTEIVFAIDHRGLGEFENSDDQKIIDVDAFVDFIGNSLQIPIPEALKKEN